MKTSRILMMVGSLLLMALFFLPLWNISLEAPQYPEAIGMDIWINKIADHNPYDIKNINLMNHYVGMKEIPEHLPEFDIFPLVIIGMSVLGIVFGIIENKNLYLVWFIVMVGLGVAGMYDFYLWEYDYGHTLKENAAIKFTNPDGTPLAYQPPLFGSKTILNFNAISLPMSGAYVLFTGMMMTLLAYFKARRE
jgi:copper chaperone NosL